MKKMLIILMIMAACLANSAFAVPNGLANPGFENDTAGVCDNWAIWGEDVSGMVYQTGDAGNAHSGDDYYEVGRGTGGWAGLNSELILDVPITGGADVTLSAYMRWANGETASDGTLKLEYYATAGEGWVEGGTPFTEVTFVLTGSYALYSATGTAPVGTNFARATIVAAAGTSFYIDDVSLCEGSVPCAITSAVLVSPDNTSFVDPAAAGANDLVWTLPDPIGAGPVTCDVWYNINDPNMANPGAVQLLSGSTAETVTIGTPIVLGNNYYWRVDCYDPDATPVKTEGQVWEFNTINTAPTAEAGFDRNAWLENGSVTVVLDPKPNANDDVDNYPGPLTAVMSTTGGTFDTAPGEDPNTITFTAAGTYTLTMTADDDGPGTAGLITTDSFDITVYAEGTAENYLVAHYPFDVDASDATVNGHDGTLSGDAAISVADTQVGAGALLLDGTDDFVFIDDSVHPTDPNLITWADFGSAGQSEEVTISVWIKPAAWSASWTQVVSKGYPGGYRITRGDYDGVVFAADLDWDGGVVYGSDIYQMGDGNWHHLVATWDGGASALYIDGNFQYRMPQPHDTLLIKNKAQLQIGANANADSSQHFNGLIDEVRVYDVGLSHAEVLKLYASQGGSGTCGKVYSAIDLSQDCVINFVDFAMFASDWLDCRDPITCP